MVSKRCALFIVAVFLCLLCSGCNLRNQVQLQEAFIAPAVTGELQFSVLKIGKADAIIIQTENHSLIIDCGEEEDGDEIIEYLTENHISSVDYLFITHFDKDHVGGAAEVIRNREIKQIIVPDYAGTNAAYENFLDAVEETGSKPLALTETMVFVLDDVLFEIYPPQKTFYVESDNDFSLAISVTHGDNKFLFAGDAEEIRLAEILSQTQTQYDFLKMPHHGKFDVLTKQFVDSISPTYTVITCSEKNPADEQTVNILKAAGSEVYYTKDGDITVSSNGTDITIKQ